MYQFQRWIISLGAYVRFLHDSPSFKDIQRLKRAVANCEAELQLLYAHAEEHHLDLLAYYRPLAEIEKYLLLMYEYLALEQANINK